MPSRTAVRHRAVLEHRSRPVLWGAVAAAAVLAAGLSAAAVSGLGKTQTQAAVGGAPRATSACAAPGGDCPDQAIASLDRQFLHHSSRHATRRKPAATPTRRAAARPQVPAAAPAGGQPGSAALQVLALINRARAQVGLPAYTLTAGLDSSAGAHNALMAGGCGLSHQCPGEPSLGGRESAAGVAWTAAGENVGEGGPVADSVAAIGQMATSLTEDMLAEQAPNDGHRQNILSSVFRHIGIAVYRDSSGTVWMTQDFSN